MKRLLTAVFVLVMACAGAATYQNFFTMNPNTAMYQNTNRATLVYDITNKLFVGPGITTSISQRGVYPGAVLSGLSPAVSEFKLLNVDGTEEVLFLLGSATLENMTLTLQTNGGTETAWVATDVGVTNVLFRNMVINATFDLLHPTSATGAQFTFENCTVYSSFDRFLSIDNDTNSSLIIKNSTVFYDPRGRSYNPYESNQADQCYWNTWIENVVFDYTTGVSNGPSGTAVFGFAHNQRGGSLYMKDVHFNFRFITNAGAIFVRPTDLAHMATTNGALVFMDNVSWVETNGNFFTFSTSTTDNFRMTNTPPSRLDWSGLSVAAFTNGVAARIPVYTNSGTVYYLTLSTNTP